MIRQPTYGEQNLAHEEPFACVVYRREGVFDRPFKSDGDYTSFTVGLDRYQRLCHHDHTADLLSFAARAGLTVVAVDNVPGAARLEQTTLPRNCLLVFGQEGPGISDDARAGASLTVSIAQFGSTRSINVAVAAGIAMHTWITQHGNIASAW